jgi:hypothetical protein
VRAVRILQALIVCGAMALLLGLLVLREDDVPPQRVGFELVPFQPGGPAGTAFLERRGDRLVGTLTVWGLQPGTRHFVALRGPGPRCPAQITSALAPLASDENGVAFGRVDEPIPADAFGDGLALTVHARVDAGSAAVACGAAPGGRRLSQADLTQLGGRETGEPGTQVSALLQLRDGRPVGRRGPLEIRARRGEQVALALRADAPDELQVEGYGLAVQVGPGTIARLAFRADRPGRFAIAGRTTGDRPAGVLIVE